MSDFEFVKPKRGAKPQEEVKLEEQKQAVVIKSGEGEEKKAKESDKPKFDKDELLRIFDEIIFNGEYVEDVTIKGKLKVQFRTRSAEELSEISRLLDSTTYNLVTTLNENRLLLNLQYALVSYQGNLLGTLKNEERAKFVRRLPGPVIASLIDALFKFDEKVAAACQETEENF